jgi:IS30 family transposase
MSGLQKNEIARMRGEGMSYAKIASALGMSPNTVKSHCQRNRLGGALDTGDAVMAVCQNCGRTMAQRPGRKPKRFCSDACRMAWWKAHPERLSRKAVYALVCAGCGKPFESYGNKGCKYCSHACYVKARFGGGG